MAMRKASDLKVLRTWAGRSDSSATSRAWQALSAGTVGIRALGETPMILGSLRRRLLAFLL